MSTVDRLWDIVHRTEQAQPQNNSEQVSKYRLLITLYQEILWLTPADRIRLGRIIDTYRAAYRAYRALELLDQERRDDQNRRNLWDSD